MAESAFPSLLRSPREPDAAEDAGLGLGIPAASRPLGDDSDLEGEADRELLGPEGINRAGGPRAGRKQRLRTWGRTVMAWDGILKNRMGGMMGKSKCLYLDLIDSGSGQARRPSLTHGGWAAMRDAATARGGRSETIDRTAAADQRSDGDSAGGINEVNE